MWQWLLIAAFTTSVQAGSPNGPSSPEEAEILWKDGQARYESGKYEDAVYLLQRFIDRYPGATGYLEAHLYLGKALLESDHPDRALKPLREYVEGAGTGPHALQGRVLLGEAYIALNQHSQAYLTSQELEKKNSSGNPAVLADALLLRTQALIGEQDDVRAGNSLASARKLVLADPDSRRLGQTHRLEMLLKIRTCAKLPTLGAGDEAQVRSQIDRRGTCLLEALVPFRNTLESKDEPSAQVAEVQLILAFEKYQTACTADYTPKSMGKKKRTAKELKRYKSELRELLVQECRRKYLSASDTLKAWNRPNEALSTREPNRLKEVSKALEKLINPSSLEGNS